MPDAVNTQTENRCIRPKASILSPHPVKRFFHSTYMLDWGGNILAIIMLYPNSGVPDNFSTISFRIMKPTTAAAINKRDLTK